MSGYKLDAFTGYLFYSLNVVLEIKVALWQCEKIDVSQLQCHITFA